MNSYRRRRHRSEEHRRQAVPLLRVLAKRHAWVAYRNVEKLQIGHGRKQCSETEQESRRSGVQDTDKVLLRGQRESVTCTHNALPLSITQTLRPLIVTRDGSLGEDDEPQRVPLSHLVRGPGKSVQGAGEIQAVCCP